jgi:hypothetical protein
MDWLWGTVDHRSAAASASGDHCRSRNSGAHAFARKFCKVAILLRKEIK